VRLLLEHRADVHAQNQLGGTALHGAAGRGHEAVARLLLKHGADVHAQDQDSWEGTALSLAGFFLLLKDSSVVAIFRHHLILYAL
jgi:ankyrin repeat protein